MIPMVAFTYRPSLELTSLLDEYTVNLLIGCRKLREVDLLRLAVKPTTQNTLVLHLCNFQMLNGIKWIIL